MARRVAANVGMMNRASYSGPMSSAARRRSEGPPPLILDAGAFGLTPGNPLPQSVQSFQTGNVVFPASWDGGKQQTLSNRNTIVIIVAYFYILYADCRYSTDRPRN